MNAALRTSASDLRPTVQQPETNADTPRGFTQVPNEVLFDRNLSDGAMRLYALLLHYARQSDRCWPSQETLAKDLGLCRKTIHRRLSELESKSLVAHKRGGDGKPAYYLLSVTVGARESRQSCPAPGQDCPEQMGHICPVEEQAVDVEAVKHTARRTATPPPPEEARAGGGQVAQSVSSEADDLTDHADRATGAYRPGLAKELRDFGVPPKHAAAFAATDYPEEVARSICRQANRDGVNGGVKAWRLKHHAPAVEQELARRGHSDGADPMEAARAAAIRRCFEQATGFEWPGGEPPGYWRLAEELRCRGTAELQSWAELMESIPAEVVPDDAVPVEWYLSAATDALRRPWA